MLSQFFKVHSMMLAPKTPQHNQVSQHQAKKHPLWMCLLGNGLPFQED